MWDSHFTTCSISIQVPCVNIFMRIFYVEQPLYNMQHIFNTSTLCKHCYENILCGTVSLQHATYIQCKYRVLTVFANHMFVF